MCIMMLHYMCQGCSQDFGKGGGGADQHAT